MGAIGPTGGRLRGGGPRLCVDNGMELYVLWWVLWRRAQALRENMRKSVLAPQNKNALTAPLNQESRLSHRFSRPVFPLPNPGFFPGLSVQPALPYPRM